MNCTDPIADLLTRIRNANIAKLRYAQVPASRLKIEVVALLEEKGFIQGFRLIRDNGQGKIKIALKYRAQGQSVIHGLKRVSKPGCRVYAGVKDLKPVFGGLGVAILSTPKGVMTDDKARNLKAGGEILAHIW